MRFFKSLWLIPMGERLSVSPFFLIMAAAAMFFGYADMFFIAYLSAFFHECAHIAAARSLRDTAVRDLRKARRGLCKEPI